MPDKHLKKRLVTRTVKGKTQVFFQGFWVGANGRETFKGASAVGLEDLAREGEGSTMEQGGVSDEFVFDPRYEKLAYRLACGESLDGMNLTGMDLRGFDFAGVNMSGVNCSEADLRGVNLSGANLGGAIMMYVDAADATFEGANLEGAILCGSRMLRTKFYGANLGRAVWSSGDDHLETDLSLADLRDVDFTGAHLTNINFHMADLRGANFEGMSFDMVVFQDSDLSGASFRNADISNLEFDGAVFSETILDGANVSGCWFPRDLTEVKLTAEQFESLGNQDVCDYRKYTFYDALEVMGVNEQTLELMIIAGTVQVRENDGNQIVSKGFDPNTQHITEWEVEKHLEAKKNG